MHMHAFQHPSGQPTRSPADFEAIYASTPAWDIGRPQAAFVALAEAGRWRGRVVDVGCGTGEHTLLAAEMGLDATGVDAAPTAIARAQAKAQVRGLTAAFILFDALRLPDLGQQFDVVLDCGLFHVFSDEDRSRFVASVSAVVPPGGKYYMLCFSEHQPGEWGPRRITQPEITAAFGAVWDIDSIEPSTLEVTIDPAGAQAWLAAMTRKRD
jgi:SAM-dependent methyltransferase